MKKVLLSVFLASVAFINAQVSYGFEAPTYTTTNIAGQNGWGGTSGTYIAQVSNAMANPGTQSLKLTGNNGTVHTAAGAISPTSEVLPDASGKVTVVFNAYFVTATTAGNESDFFFSAQSPAESTINARMHFTWDGNIRVIDGATPAYVDTTVDFTKDAWHSYRIELDFTADVAKYYQDNVLIYTGGVVGGTKVGNLAITNDNYDSAAYFDGISYYAGSLSTTEVSNKKIGISFYPNPTSDFLNIKTDSKIKSVSVFDMSGRKVKTSFENNVLNVKDLQTGTYIINVDTTDGKFSERFIKK